MDVRSFSSRHPLLFMMSCSSAELRRLRVILRVRRGSLRWTGRWGSFAVPKEMEDSDARLLVQALLYQRPLPKRTLLPSEERLLGELMRAVRAWHSDTSCWQIVVSGEPSWTPEEAGIWRRELDLWVGRWLYRVWRLRRTIDGICSWAVYRARRLKLALLGIVFRPRSV